jgi:Neuraminidase (sialidase)
MAAALVASFAAAVSIAGALTAGSASTGVSAAPLSEPEGMGPRFQSPLVLDTHPPMGRISNLYGGPGVEGNAELATDGAGHWVAVWHSSDSLGDRIGRDWDILISRSHDNGATWSKQEPLNRNAAVDGGEDLSPVVETDEAGTWIVAWSSDETFGGIYGRDRDIFFARSTNNGRTWTQPAPLNSNAASDWGADTEVRVGTDGGAKWVAVWTSTDSLANRIGGDGDILVARSSDNGATWTAPEPLNTNAPSDDGFDTSADIVTDGSGRWVAVWSSGNSRGASLGMDRDILISRSDDAGETWADPAPLNSAATSDSNSDWSPRLASDGRGHWVAVWTSNDSLGDAIGVDRDVLMSRSSDNAKTWTPARALNLNAAVDSREDASPSIVTDGVGHWLVAWHAWGGFTYDDGSDADIVVAYSSDDGQSWSVPVHANTLAGSDVVDDIQPGLATDGSGTWIAIWRAFYPAADLSGGSEWRINTARATIADVAASAK